MGRPLPAEVVGAIVARVAAGERVTVVAAELGVARRTVRRHVLAATVPERPPCMSPGDMARWCDLNDRLRLRPGRVASPCRDCPLDGEWQRRQQDLGRCLR